MSYLAQCIGISVALGLVPHLLGDYLFQNDWMAQRKTKLWRAALIHGFCYGLPFLPLLLIGALEYPGWLILTSTHAVIDRFGLGRKLAAWAGVATPTSWTVKFCLWVDPAANLQPTPAPLAMWLPIITDNTVHILINSACILWAIYS